MQEMIRKVEVELLGGDYVLVTEDDAKPGTLYIEGRIRDDTLCATTKELQRSLELRLSSSMLSFEIWDDILANPRVASDVLGKIYKDTTEFIQSLKVVEYVGTRTESTCFQLSAVRVKVQVYQMYDDVRSLIENKDLPQAEITSLPHLRFEGRWDELVFDHDLKSELIWMMYNILRFSTNTGKSANDMNPLILLHGPPGTGKTTLCQGLAQKISIRLSDRYKETKLIEIKTATLLSKFFSESAKKVEETFTKICQMCEEDDQTFICVLIDEVESIANSREATTKNGESQDSLRATNALLTGIDRSKGYANVMFLCTSNFLTSLDSAFLDRCALRQAVGPPSTRSQYAILCGRIQGLMNRGVVKSQVILPTLDDAKIDFVEKKADSPGRKLLQIVEHIRTINSRREFGLEISGRSLAQLPKTAILRYLREEDCDLDMALDFIEQYVLSGQTHRKRKPEEETTPIGSATEAYEGVEVRGKRRKLIILLEEECDEDFLKEIVTNLRGSDQKSSVLKFEEEEELE